MSTDHKKTVRTIVIAYFLACMFLITGMQMNYALLPVIVFVSIAVMLFLTSIMSLHKQYKKYHITIYLYLELVGIGFIIYSLYLVYATYIAL